MGAKRQATRQPARAGKKAKLDPVSAKVKEVLDALERDDCEVSPPTFREGLIAAFPLAMGVGCAKDERHSYQEKLGNVVLEIFQTTKAKFEETHKAAKEEHAAADAVKSSKEGTVAAAEATLEEHKKAESDARDTHLSSSDAVTDARKKLEAASSEVETFDATQLQKAKERAEFGSALETEFATLKDGTVEDAKEKKALFSTLSKVMEKIGVDKALISAALPALSKAASARGSFDVTVVEQVETALRARVDSLQEELNNGETVKAGKVAEQAVAQEVLNAAEVKLTEDQSKETEAEAQTKESKNALKQAKDDLKEQEKIVADLDIKAYYQESHLCNFQDAIAALEVLRDRESTVPEAEAEKVLATEAAITMDEINVVAA